MRLLIVIDQLDVGGAENQLRQTLPRLVAKGFDITIFTLLRPGQYANELRSKGIRVIAPPAFKVLRKTGFFSKPSQILCSAAKLISLYLTHSFNLIHFYLPRSYIVGGLCALLTRQHNLIMSRRSLNDYQKNKSISAKCEKFLHQRMQHIIVNSNAIKQQLIKEEGVLGDKITVIYNGIDAEKYQSLRVEKPENQLTLITVANLYPYKGHALLLNAVAKADLPQDWQVWCVGRDAGELTHLQQLAKTLGIDSHVQWLGKRNDVPTLLNQADIGIQVSQQEGFSNSVLEGMAAGLPMIVTDVGGNPEAVTHNETGLVILNNDQVALTDAINQLAKNVALRHKLGNAAKCSIENSFSLSRCSQYYSDIYNTLSAS